MRGTFSGHITVVAAGDSLSSADLGDEAVFLNFGTGKYYSLSSTGFRIWNLIQQSETVEAIRDAIVREYSVDPKQCEQDLQKFLWDLADHGFIETSQQR